MGSGTNSRQRRVKMRVERMILVGIAGIVVGLVGMASAQTTAVVWPAAAIKWTDNAALPGGKSATPGGGPPKGGYGGLKEVPAGTVLAEHTPRNDSHVVVVKGNVKLDVEGKKTAPRRG